MEKIFTFDNHDPSTMLRHGCQAGGLSNCFVSSFRRRQRELPRREKEHAERAFQPLPLFQSFALALFQSFISFHIDAADHYYTVNRANQVRFIFSSSPSLYSVFTETLI